MSKLSAEHSWAINALKNDFALQITEERSIGPNTLGTRSSRFEARPCGFDWSVKEVSCLWISHTQMGSGPTEPEFSDRWVWVPPPIIV
jgi:hypothetical protein